MFEFSGFGQRLQGLRKQKQMTQEELAERIGVTAQAVSKWENDLSYPDITSIPTLVTILETKIEYLFGKKEESKTQAVSFGENYLGLPLVHKYGDRACYSGKAVESVLGSGVKFADGSAAELSNGRIINMGNGEIKILSADDVLEIDVDEYGEISKKEFEFGYCDSVYVEVLMNDCEIVHSADGKTKVYAVGDRKFMQKLRVENEDTTVKIYFEQTTGNYTFSSDNRIVLELPCQAGKMAEVAINGRGLLTCAIGEFCGGKLAINGSGKIEMGDFTNCRVAINGSGSVAAGKVCEADLSINGSGAVSFKEGLNAKLNINGSGDIKADRLESVNVKINGSGNVVVDRLEGDGDFFAKINGSGDIEINRGNCKKFDIDIIGSGNINAHGLTATSASIVLHHSGTVTLGRVIEHSTEQIKKKGKINILKRGAQN